MANMSQPFSVHSYSFVMIVVAIYKIGTLIMKYFTAICLVAILILSTSNAFAGGGRHHYRHHGSHGGGYFLGGLVVANILGNISHRHHYHGISTERAVVLPRSDVGHWLLLDLKGRCYEVIRQEDGTEVRKEVAKEVCDG